MAWQNKVWSRLNKATATLGMLDHPYSAPKQGHCCTLTWQQENKEWLKKKAMCQDFLHDRFGKNEVLVLTVEIVLCETVTNLTVLGWGEIFFNRINRQRDEVWKRETKASKLQPNTKKGKLLGKTQLRVTPHGLALWAELAALTRLTLRRPSVELLNSVCWAIAGKSLLILIGGTHL